MKKRQKCIVLCGFMGCGKSTVGRELAQLLSRDFVDLDSFIERRAGRTIPELFAAEGEEAFRTLESAALRELCTREGLVLAAGGGALLRAENVEAVHKAGGHILFLNCPFHACYRRIKNSSRPIVRRSTPEELAALYAQRLPLYRAACDICVEVAGTSAEVAQAAALALDEAR